MYVLCACQSRLGMSIRNVCLCGGEEHRSLKLSQFKREATPPRYIYTECASKNRAGGLAQMNKVVPIYAVEEVGDRLHEILDMYVF